MNLLNRNVEQAGRAYPGPSPKEVGEQVPPIAEDLMTLRKQATEICEQLGKLERRFEPVLAKTLTEARAAEIGNPVPANRSPMEEQMAELRDILGSALGRILDLQSRVRC